MSSLHGALGWLALAATIWVVAAAVLLAVGRSPSHRLVDRAILVQVAVTLAASLVGFVPLLTGPGPVDSLHFLYGVVSVAALPVARYWGHGRRSATLGRWLALAGLVVTGTLLRSIGTGG